MNRNEQCLAGAIKLGDRLLANMTTDENGSYWETLSQTAELEPVWGKANSFYSGNPGVAFFLLELHRVTGEEKYKNAALAALDWSHKTAMANETPHLAYLTGVLSAARGMLHAAAVTGDGAWKQKALEIASTYNDKDVLGPTATDDLLNGKAGALLGLMYIHAETGEDWILDKLDQICAVTIREGLPGGRGLFWDRSDQHIKGLCGFTHGSAGVGFAFIELARYVNNPALFEVARQAFAYETHLFDENEGWPDLRRGVFSEKDLVEHREHYIKGDRAWFSEKKYMNAWCHGAPGIALSRLRAWEVMQEDTYRQHALQALAILDRMHPKKVSLTLCHGWFGDLNTYLYASEILGDESWLQQDFADEAIQRVLDDDNFTSGYMMLDPGLECPSLFMGIAGVGYSLLRWRDPGNTPGILCPTQDKTSPVPVDPARWPNLTMDKAAVHRLMVSYYFSRTLEIADAAIPQQTKDFFANLSEESDFNGAFMEWAQQQSESAGDDRLKEIFEMESRVYARDQAVDSHAYLRGRLTFHSEALTERDRLETVEQDDVLVLDEFIVITENNFNWLRDQGPLGAPLAEPTRMLIHPQATEIMETPVNVFTAEILLAFQEPCSVKDAIKGLLDLFELDNPDEAAQVHELASRQVHEALKAGLLFFAN